jgi:Tol biopolymer transport system component
LWVQRITGDGSAAGPPELLSQSFRSYTGLTWIDNQSVITATGTMGGSAGLFRVDRDKGVRPLGIEPLAAWYPHYARAHKRLAYQRRTIDTDVMRVTLGESVAMEPRPLIASTYQDRDAMYSPDGTKVVFISTRTGQPAIWRANSDGTNQVLIGAVDHAVPGGPRWTPDNRSIVFDASSETGSDVFIVSAEGGNPRRVTSRPGHKNRPTVSRDGQWVYFVSVGELWKVSIKGGEAVRLAPNAGMGRESINGDRLYFSRGDEVWHMPTQGGPAELFKADIRPGEWSLTEEDLYQVRVRPGAAPQLVAHNLQTRMERLLYTFPRTMDFFAANFVDISPDGRFALVSPITRDESDLVVVDGFR